MNLLNKHVAFWLCFVMVLVNAGLFFASLHSPALAHLTRYHLLCLGFAAMAAFLNYIRDDE